MHETLVLVFERYDPTAGFHFGVGTEPFAPRDLVKEIPERAVAGHGCGIAKNNLPHVYGEVFVRVMVLDELSAA